jgi:hypothetical protein
LFTFTLAGRKLPPTFIFKGMPKGRLAGAAEKWSANYLPADQHAWFYFNKAAFMTAVVYCQYLKQVRAYMDRKMPEAKRRIILLGHDRAKGHMEQYIAQVHPPLELP